MATYVDDMEAPFGRMIMCHMIADTRAELLEMARVIGVAKKWIQHRGSPEEHFDICKAMRAKAVKAGAKEIHMVDLGGMCWNRREGWPGNYLEPHPQKRTDRAERAETDD